MKSICDLHTHSVLSNHAFSSLTENIAKANELGLKFYGISEHQPDNVGVGAQKECFLALDRVPRYINDTYVLRGCEFNILEEGNIDLANTNISRLDYGIASFHGYVYKGSRDIETITRAYLNVLEIPYIKILGHIDDGSYKTDYEKVVLKCKETHKLIEINNSSLKPNSYRTNPYTNYLEVLKWCKKYEQPVIINSDAHICYEVGDLTYGEKIIEDSGFDNKLVLNYNEELFRDYFNVEVKI